MDKKNTERIIAQIQHKPLLQGIFSINILRMIKQHRYDSSVARINQMTAKALRAKNLGKATYENFILRLLRVYYTTRHNLTTEEIQEVLIRISKNENI